MYLDQPQQISTHKYGSKWAKLHCAASCTTNKHYTASLHPDLHHRYRTAELGKKQTHWIMQIVLQPEYQQCTLRLDQLVFGCFILTDWGERISLCTYMAVYRQAICILLWSCSTAAELGIMLRTPYSADCITSNPSPSSA